MNLDVEVAMLKPMKAHHDSKRYKWHHRLRKCFPEGGGGEIMGDFLTSRENAGAALIQAYKDLFTDHAKEIGSSRDFPLYPEY